MIDIQSIQRATGFLIVFSMVSLLFFSCRKGEDDPLVSLRSRRARVAGNWRFYEGNAMITTTQQGVSVNYIFKLRGTKFDVNWSYSGSQVVYVSNGGYILSLTCDKEGNFSLKEIIQNGNLQCEGTWSFNERSSNHKGKELLQFRIHTVNSGKTDETLFNMGTTNFTYEIKELRHKRLVLHVQGQIYFNAASGIEQKYSGDYTFIQD